MSRVKSGKVTHARHRKVIKQAAGYYSARSRNFRTATQAVDKANQYATRDRKARKRSFRALWIQRINAAVRLFDAEMTYSRLINGLMDIAVAQKDYIGQDFLRWFVTEQLEEVSSMETLLTVVKSAGEKNLFMLEAYLAH